MSSDDLHWRRVRQLFLEVSTLEPAAREDWLQGVDDTAVDSAVRRLLALHDELTGSDQGLPVVPVADALAAAFERAEHRRDDAIAEFRIERVIGEGGMGRVYLASREVGDALQRVALKIVPFAVHGPRIVEQLRRERAILAGLDHPNIARLIDAGELPDNRPYFAMEYVDGVPITRYCDDARLDLRARITLFLDVCDAVAYAHRQLVLHRDLKPNNILTDAVGRVRLLDFGIAKSLEGTEHARDTTLGGNFFSLRAAAPEQVLGHATSVATDVYGLGCLLYELLAGALPFAFADRTREDIVRLIVEQPPALASATVLAQTDDTAAANRQLADAGALAAALRGDLDTILAKSLRKNPAERYRSVDELAADLHNVLDFRPIAARASERWYRARMLLRRHRVTALVASVLGLAVIATTALSVAQSLRAEAERDRAVAALASAQLQRDHAQRVTDFLVNAFRAADPGKGRGTEMRAGELLDRASKTLEQTGAAPDPALHATIAQTLSHLFYRLDRAPDAVRQAEIARAQIDHVAQPPLDLLTRQSLAEAGAAMLQGRYAAAAETAQQGIDRVSDPLQFEDGSLLHRLWEVRLLAVYMLGDQGAALRVADAALAVLSARTDHRPEQVDWLRHRRAMVLTGAGNFQQALVEIETLAADQRAGNRVNDASHVDVLRVLAQTHSRLGQYEQGLAIYDEAMRKHLALYGEDHPLILHLLGGMASTYGSAGRQYESLQLFRHVAMLGRKHYGDKHNFVAALYFYTADVYFREFDDFPAAEFFLHRAMDAVPQDARGNRAIYRRQLGTVYLLQNKRVEAEYALAQANDELRTVYSTGPQLDMGLIGLAYARLQRFDLSGAAAPLSGSLLHSIRNSTFADAYTIRQADELSAFLGWNRESDASTIVPPLRR